MYPKYCLSGQVYKAAHVVGVRTSEILDPVRVALTDARCADTLPPQATLVDQPSSRYAVDSLEDASTCVRIDRLFLDPLLLDQAMLGCDRCGTVDSSCK